MCFINFSDIKTVKDSKHHFLKVSESLDNALYKNASANKNRPQEILECDNYLVAAHSCFRHIALDYVKTLTMLQSKKRPEVLSTVNLNEYFYTTLRKLCNNQTISVFQNKFFSCSVIFKHVLPTTIKGLIYVKILILFLNVLLMM